MEKAIVVLSGGQDSTTCLHWALNRYAEVRAITFDYGQKHRIEIEQAEKIADLNKVEWELIKIPSLAGTSPLTNPDVELGKYEQIDDLPDGIEPTFIPARNLIFLSIAANRAAAWGAIAMITGVCQEDFGGYPDCRRVFIDHLEYTIASALEGSCERISILTPLMDLTKAESVLLADREGAWESLALSQTCYEGMRPPCGHCHACHLRQRGFKEAGMADPLDTIP
jgi:7-cyano-7-deazaguanine synthase